MNPITNRHWSRNQSSRFLLLMKAQVYSSTKRAYWAMPMTAPSISMYRLSNWTAQPMPTLPLLPLPVPSTLMAFSRSLKKNWWPWKINPSVLFMQCPTRATTCTVPRVSCMVKYASINRGLPHRVISSTWPPTSIPSRWPFTSILCIQTRA